MLWHWAPWFRLQYWKMAWVWNYCGALEKYLFTFSRKLSQQKPLSSPVRARYVRSFAISDFDKYSILVTEVTNVLICCLDRVIKMLHCISSINTSRAMYTDVCWLVPTYLPTHVNASTLIKGSIFLRTFYILLSISRLGTEGSCTRKCRSWQANKDCSGGHFTNMN